MTHIVDWVDNSHYEVRAGQTQDEVIAGHVQPPMAQDTLYDESISDDVHCTYQANAANVEDVEHYVVRC